MTRREWGWFFLATGGVGAFLATGAGLVAAIRWAWLHGLTWLRETHLETLIALSLVALVALCFVVALLAARPAVSRPPERVRGGIGPAEMRRLAELQAGAQRSTFDRTGGNFASGISGARVATDNPVGESDALGGAGVAGMGRTAARRPLSQIQRRGAA